MASALIHLAIAELLEKDLSISDRKDYLLGSIAPDIAKQINESKIKSHFLYNTEDGIPNIKMFKEKYKDFKSNSFLLGYYIHLYTDKVWFGDFINSIYYNNSIKLLDGTIIEMSQDEIRKIIYEDYTNLNLELISNYNLDLSLFYEDFKIPNTTLDEIPIEKLNILIDKMGIIIENSKQQKKFLFDIIIIKNFIDSTCKEILKDLAK